MTNVTNLMTLNLTNVKMKQGLALAFCALVAGGLSGCAGPSIRGDKKITAASSGSVPAWVKDSSNHDQKQLGKIFDDNTDNPKYYYVVSQAHVDSENLISSCYNFARANANGELASGVHEVVNGATSTAGDSSEDSAYAVQTIHTQAALVGSQTMARYWEKTEDKDQSSIVNCYLVTAIPMKNFNELKSIYLRKIGKTGMDKATRQKAEKAVEDQGE